MKKLLIVAAFFASFVLSGCQKDAAVERDPPGMTTSNFTLSFQDLPGNMASSTSQFFDGEAVYLCGRELNETPVLGKLLGAEFDKYPVPEGISYLHACCKAEEELAVVAGDFPAAGHDAAGQFCESPQENYALYLLRYDEAGNLIGQVPIDFSNESGVNVSSARYLDGFFYLLSPNALIQIDSSGQVKNSLCPDGLSFISQCIVQDWVAVCYYDITEGTTKISLISPDTDLRLETIFSDASIIVSGIGVSELGELLLIADHAVCSYSQVNNTLEEVYDFYESGVLDAEYSNIFEFNGNYWLGRSFQKNIIGLVYEETAEKKPLILWTFYVDKYLEKLVTGFNQTHSDYQIQVEDVGNIEDSQLKAKIISGAGPDLYLPGSSGRFSELNSEAVFEDLAPFIQNSSSVSEENLILPLVASVNSGDRIFQFPVTFILYTAVCKNDIATASTMSLDELNNLPQVQNGEVSIVPSYLGSEGAWSWLSNLYICKYLDRENDSCNFETDEFIELLEFCATINKTPQSQNIPSIYNFEWIPGTLRMLYYQKTYGESFELNTAFGSGFGVEMSFAISNTSKNKDGAWKFIEYCHFADIAGEGFSLPASAARLDKLLDEACSSGVWWPETRQYIPLSSYTADMLKDAIYRTKNTYASDGIIQNIMQEEANKFFAGDRSAEETASMIQSRVAIYLSEQYG